MGRRALFGAPHPGAGSGASHSRDPCSFDGASRHEHLLEKGVDQLAPRMRILRRFGDVLDSVAHRERYPTGRGQAHMALLGSETPGEGLGVPINGAALSAFIERNRNGHAFGMDQPCAHDRRLLVGRPNYSESDRSRIATGREGSFRQGVSVTYLAYGEDGFGLPRASRGICLFVPAG